MHITSLMTAELITPPSRVPSNRFSHTDRAAATLSGVVTIFVLAALTPAVAAAQSLPSGWSVSDIGAPTIHGSASASGTTTFSVSGAGTDIWGTSDQFTFAYRQLTGDGMVTARVTSVQNTDAWTKGGVMIRESLSAKSAHGLMLVSSGKGLAFQRRTGTGSISTSTAGSMSRAPMWVRLERRGVVIVAYSSADGLAWTKVGADIIPMASTVYVGLAVTSHKASAAGTVSFTNVDVSPQFSDNGALPSGWQSTDIGLPAKAGTSWSMPGSFVVTGGGTDVWGSSDQFQFAYKRIDGDVDITALVSAEQKTNAWTKAGVMIRDSLTANAAHASMFISPGKGSAFQRRPQAGGTSVNTSGGTTITAPYWVKLSLRGSTVTASQSKDGTTWNTVGTQTLTLPSPFYVGLAVSSHVATADATALFDQVSVQGGSGGSNHSPTISLTSPAAGATFTAPATVSMAASAADSDGTIARVEFYSNGALLGSDATAPYTFSWTKVAAGNYNITAVAYDDEDASTTSTAHAITVSGAANQPPTVSMTSPASGSTYTAPATVALAASASDADGTVTRVDFFANSTLVATASGAPFNANWSNVAAGSYSITAVATDDDGATKTSGAIGITVNGVNKPPTVSLTAPSSGATFVAPATITVSATAADTDGTVSTVDFYAGSTLIGSDSTSPYSVAWSNVAAGSYSLTAIAVDNKGATTTSAARTITVSNPSSLPAGWAAADIGAAPGGGGRRARGGTVTGPGSG
jgi:regulation of enolase protein 1 (concanavalin A-like superfamily)